MARKTDHTHIAELNGYSIECTPVREIPGTGCTEVIKRHRVKTMVGTKTLRPRTGPEDHATHY